MYNKSTGMAKSELRLKAIKMRSRGESVRDIAEKLKVSKSSASIWVRDVILSVKQLEDLQNRKIRGWELARLNGAFSQKKKRLDLISKEKLNGINQLSRMTDGEFFVSGVALYWAEGSKKKREFYICNSDPKMIVFMIKWMKKFFGIQTSDLKAVVGINEVHKKRETLIKNYWSEITGIPLDQFRKTSFKKTKIFKQYENFNEHFGTLAIHVLKGSHFYYKMLGLIEGLSEVGRKY